MTEIEQLNISLTQSHNRNTNLTEEKDELQTRYDILNKNCNLLQDELDKLRTMYRGATCLKYADPTESRVDTRPTLPPSTFPPEFFFFSGDHDLDD